MTVFVSFGEEIGIRNLLMIYGYILPEIGFEAFIIQLVVDTFHFLCIG